MIVLPTIDEQKKCHVLLSACMKEGSFLKLTESKDGPATIMLKILSIIFSRIFLNFTYYSL